MYSRFLALYGDKEPTPQQVVDTRFETLRGIGLSNAKASYIQNIAQYALDHDMSDKKLYNMSNDLLMDFLLPIKGVGKWTVEMQLMFALGREDVFAIDDFGIQQAMIKLYNLDATDKKLLKEKMLKISSLWSPYRTYACLYLWNYKDGIK
jgi:DNA-3-methyladenine glycosylase II